MPTAAGRACRVAIVLSAALLGAAPGQARGEADGPDHFRVTGVRPGNVLNIRAGPGVDHAKIGGVPADARGLRNLGCEGGLSYAEWVEASPSERAAARHERWCRTAFDGEIGWVAGWHLGEDGPPAEPAFDCAEAESSAERLVCSDPLLAALDRETARLFRLARAGAHMTDDRRNELVTFQRGWIKGRDDCWKADDLRSCVIDEYAIRIHELRQGYVDARLDDDQGISTGPLVAVCAGFDAMIGLTFVKTEPPLVVLAWRDQNRVLSLRRSASGALYEEDATLFWIKGEEARFDPSAGESYGCRLEGPG